MIAHINRSGEMFHQNLNVLGYAAISTNVKPLNQNLNRSIMMSAQKKKNRSKSRSCLKKKETIEEDQSKKGLSPISMAKSEKKKKVKIEEDKELQTAMKKESEARRKEMMNNYIHQLIGRQDVISSQLDH